MKACRLRSAATHKPDDAAIGSNGKGLSDITEIAAANGIAFYGTSCSKLLKR
jgi:hypothetical protein